MALHYYIHKQTQAIYLLQNIPLFTIVQHPITRKGVVHHPYGGSGGVYMMPQSEGADLIVYAKQDQSEYNPCKWIKENFEEVKS